MNTSISKLETLVLTAALLVGGAALTAAHGAPTVSVPPFVYTGRIVNYEGDSYDSVASKKAEIRARKNGKLIARSTIAALEGDTSANYTLVIPMSTDSSATDAAYKGDKLTFEIAADNSNKIYTETNAFVAVGNPGRTAVVNVRVASCTNEFGVADEYIEALMDYVNSDDWNGNKYTAYDPDADWDGDGVSNYNEYLAGTNPLDKGDSLEILTWEAVAENKNVMALTFLPGRNRAYSAIRRAPDSSDPFTVTPHQTSPIVNGTQHNYFITGSEDPQVRVLYLLKVGDASLYRLRLE